MEKEYIKASEYAKKMSLNVRTVYRYYHNGKIKGYQDKETGTIFILNPFKNKNNEDNLKNKVVLYARVSSSENKINLESQLEKLRLFASAKGYQIVKEIKDIGSGLNDNCSKLNELFEKELNNFEILLVEHKDRLTRFDLVDNNKEDLIQDFVSVITSFCARIYSQRISKRKVEKLIKELGNESKENS